MRILRWPLACLAVALFLGCNPNIQRQVQLSVTSEPPGAQIYENGKLIGVAPLNMVYKYEVAPVPGLLTIGKYTDGDREYFKPGDFSIQDLLRPRTFMAAKEGYKPLTQYFQFSSPHEKDLKPTGIIELGGINTWLWKGPDFFTQPGFSLVFALEPLEGASQASSRPAAPTALPGAGGTAEALGTLTILTTPAQAEVYIDFERAGTTPVSNLRVKPGQHFIEIKKSGFKTWARPVQVDAQTPVRFEIELEKL